MIDLKNILNMYPNCLSGRATFKSLLMDKYPESKRTVNILTTMFECGIAQKIKNSRSIGDNEIRRWLLQLENDYGINPQYSAECVSIWANAFDVKVQANIDTVSPATVHQSITHAHIDEQAVDSCEFQENSKFVPFVNVESYQIVASRMDENQNYINDTGHMISLLQDYVYNNSCLFPDIHANTVYKNKREALHKILSLCQNFRFNKYLYMIYLSISAQSHFMLGNYKAAVRYYEMMLSQPGVLVEAVQKDLYNGEFELAAKIIHNICIILSCSGQERLALDYRTKYEYIFELERYRAEDLTINEPHLKNKFENEWEQLYDISYIKIFYIDLTLGFALDIDDDSMLLAIYQDCKKRGKANKLECAFNDTREIQILPDGSLAVMDDEVGNIDSKIRILVIQLQG